MSGKLEYIHVGHTCTIFQKKDDGAGPTVALKVLKSDLPRPGDLAQLKNEWQIGSTLDLPGCRKVFKETLVDGRPGLEMEYIPGRPLRAWLADEAPGPDRRLDLAIQIIAALGDLHDRQVIHKDINPGNIMVSDEDGRIRIIDYGLSARTRIKEQHLDSPEVLEGTLKYISPEQTGRMNRAVDYRTDYYSFGVLLYEMVTGRLPFETGDPTALVYAHIASLPALPSSVAPSVGPDLDAVIMKLLAKNAEDRYQSARGIIHDLEACRGPAEEGFIPGQADRYDRFSIPETLYGRKKERQKLLDAFERVARTGLEMMLVSGYAGVGKSALVYEIHQSVSATDACFITGKFDQYRKNIPYSALVRAMEAFVRQILMAPEQRFNRVRENILKAVGKNGRVLTDLVPDLALIIGPQPAVPALGPKESENRLHMVFQGFVAAIARPERPLVLFLDDLQWADLASLDLIRRVFQGHGDIRLFLIGAYRDNEVSRTHPMVRMVEALEGEGRAVHRIGLSNLGTDDIQALVADTLNTERLPVRPLADLIYGKTLGNPFYARTLLSSIYRDRLLAYSEADNRWTWDMDAVRARDYSRNVVDLLVTRLNTLPRETLTLLQAGACIGNRFDLDTLALICGKSKGEVLNNILPVAALGVLEFLDSGFKLVQVQPDANTAVRFAHDRIQQAALTMMPGDEREKLHLTIGKLLLSSADDKMTAGQLFDITDQMNQGRHCLDDEDRLTVAGLNLDAGRQACSATAYAAARDYLETGLALLGDDPWQTDYALTLALYTEAAKAAYLMGDAPKGNDCSDAVLAHAESLPDRMTIHLIRMEALIAQGQWLPSLEHAVSVLRLLDIRLPAPEMADESAIAEGLGKTLALLAGRQPEDLTGLPEMTDPAVLAAMEILTISLPAAYIAAPAMFPLVVSKMVNLSLVHGNAPMSALGYANYGIVLCGTPGGTGLGYRYGQLALALLDRPDADACKARTINNVNVFLNHWQAPLKETLPALEQAWDIGLETGDLVFAGYSANARNYHAFFTGAGLEVLEQEMTDYGKALADIGQEGALQWNQIHRQTVLNLKNPAPGSDPCRLAGPAFDEEKMRPVHERNNDMVGLFYIHLYKMILSCLFHDWPGAAEHSDRAEGYLAGATGMPLVPIFYFYDALVRLAPCDATADGETRKAVLDRIEPHVEKLGQWSETGRTNYRHKYWLVRAEASRIAGDHGAAREYYDKAVSQARTHGYANEAALANELAGRYYLGREMYRQARLYLNNALICYEEWGAAAKIRQLKHTYAHLFSPGAGDESAMPLEVSTAGSEINVLIDFDTILESFTAISKEIHLEQLLQTLMEIVLKNSGADKGFFLSVSDDTFRIETLARLMDGRITHLPPEDAGLPPLPESIVLYVLRTKERVLINGTESPGQFTGDPYFDTHHPQSVLCMPIVRQSVTSGILYLENRLAMGVFTGRRIRVLDMLSAQIAISLENARIHKHLEDRVAARTRTLNEKNRELESMAAELRRANQALEILAAEDPLTGLHNRRQIFETGERLVKNGVRAAVPVSVFMLDIDYFKSFNDTYGHQAGDRCLRRVARAISSIFRRGNDVVGRYGGEEFAGILFDVGRDDMQICAQRLLKGITALAIPHRASGISDRVTASIGFTTVVPDPGTGLDGLIKIADKALYKAKAMGRNQVISLDQ